MKVCYATCLIAAFGIGMCATSVRAQDDRFNSSTPLPTTAATTPGQGILPAGQPSRVVPVSFLEEPCDACNGPACGGCCDQCTGGCDCNNPSGYTFMWAPDKWANVGVHLRTTYNNTTDNLQPPGSNIAAGNFFAVNDARLMINGKVHEYIGFDLNSELFGASGSGFPSNATLDSFGTAPAYLLLDADIKFECDDLLHVWTGQFRPPSDRTTLCGPFFINAWDLPYVSKYPNIFQGREVGAVYWGEAGGGMLQWSAGVFNGTGRSPLGAAPNLNGNPLQFAARAEVNLLDPEPGYYKQATYYGKKDILSFGFAIQTQKDALGTDVDAHNFTGWNFDELFEMKLDNDGVITLESAYYNYSTGNLNNTTTTPLLSQSVLQGESGFVYVGYLLPQCFCLGCLEGRLRPFYRYQDYHHDNVAAATQLNTTIQGSNVFSTGNDVGCDYIIRGHNARLTAFWGNRNLVGDGNINIFRVGAQIVF